MISLLVLPFLACVLLVGIHAYFGVHVLRRGIIFVDLALAQFAAFGGLVALIILGSQEGMYGYGISFLFTIFGALIFSMASRFSSIKQEALIGICYALVSALSVCVISRFNLDPHEIQHMLVGELLFVRWSDIWVSGMVYLGVGIFHFINRKAFFEDRSGFIWQFLFYATFGIVVTSSVQLGGVLLVFGFLIIPVFTVSLWTSSFKKVLSLSWILGVMASLLGLAMSVVLDIPTGASVICALGVMFIISFLCYHCGPYDRKTLI
jgi:zinc/manganese transport system permease protein